MTVNIVKMSIRGRSWNSDLLSFLWWKSVIPRGRSCKIALLGKSKPHSLCHYASLTPSFHDNMALRKNITYSRLWTAYIIWVFCFIFVITPPFCFCEYCGFMVCLSFHKNCNGIIEVRKIKHLLYLRSEQNHIEDFQF